MNDKVNYLSPVASLAVEDRSAFIWKRYAHVVGAIVAFAATIASCCWRLSPKSAPAGVTV